MKLLHQSIAIILLSIFSTASGQQAPEQTVGTYEQKFDPYGTACIKITGHAPAARCLEKVDPEGALTYFLLLPHCHQRFWEDEDLLEYDLEIEFKPGRGYKIIREKVEEEYVLPKMAGLNTIAEPLSQQVASFTLELQKDADDYEKREKDGYGGGTVRIVIQTPTILLTAHEPEVFGTVGTRVPRPDSAEDDVFDVGGENERDFGYCAFMRMNEDVEPTHTAHNPVGKDITALKLELEKPEGFMFNEEMIRLKTPARSFFYDRNGLLKENGYWLSGKRLDSAADGALGDLTANGEVMIYCEGAPAVEANGDEPALEAFNCGDCTLEILAEDDEEATRETRSPVLLFPVEVVQLAPFLVDTNGVAILGSNRPDPRPQASAMVERNPLGNPAITNANTQRIAWREVRVRICESLSGETVSWSMTPLHRPGISLGDDPGDFQTAFVGHWGRAVSPRYHSRFSEAEEFDRSRFMPADEEPEAVTNVRIPQTATTTVDEEGFTAIRVNLPPYGFNRARITISIKGIEIDLIDLEVPGVIVIDPGHGRSTGSRSDGVFEDDLAFSYAQELRTRLQRSLITSGNHHTIKFTRPAARNPGLRLRPRIARSWGADVFVSIHFNAATIRNSRRPNPVPRLSETFVERTAAQTTNDIIRGWDRRAAGANVNQEADIRLAMVLQQVVVDAVASQDQQGAGHRTTSDSNNVTLNDVEVQGVKRAGFAVTRDRDSGNVANYHPIRTCLLEVEFLTNPTARDFVRLDRASGPLIRDNFAENASSAIINNILNQQ